MLTKLRSMMINLFMAEPASATLLNLSIFTFRFSLRFFS